MDPNCSFALWNIGLGYAQQGMLIEAIAALERACEISPGVATFKGHLGYAYGLGGQSANALRVLDQLHHEAKTGYVSSYYFAIIHLGLGDCEQTFFWLDQAYQERAGFLAFLDVEPMFDPIRNQGRFVELWKLVQTGNRS
jgi:tetratricopeptide (TPR) repeat protein